MPASSPSRPRRISKTPSDSGGNNVYDLIVNVTDGAGTDSQQSRFTSMTATTRRAGRTTISRSQRTLPTRSRSRFRLQRHRRQRVCQRHRELCGEYAARPPVVGEFRIHARPVHFGGRIEAGMLTFTPTRRRLQRAGGFHLLGGRRRPERPEHRSDAEHHAVDAHGRQPDRQRRKRYQFRSHVRPVCSERVPVVQGYVRRLQQPGLRSLSYGIRLSTRSPIWR